MLDSFKARMSRVGETQSAAYLNNADMIIDNTFKRDPAYREVFVTHKPSEIENKRSTKQLVLLPRWNYKLSFL